MEIFPVMIFEGIFSGEMGELYLYAFDFPD
jgi:hypothetical protein